MKELYIFGVKFVDGSPSEIFKRIKDGGILVAPSGPGLSTVKTKHQYLYSLQQSTLAIFDSGLLCLALRLKNIKVKKLSGLQFLTLFLDYLSANKSDTILMIDPSTEESKLNFCLLVKKYNLLPENIFQYTAPIYKENEIKDQRLISIIKEKKPKHILINIGGGTQEILGNYVFKHSINLYKPTIICTGAAIAFLTGAQAKVPLLIDRLYLGWLARCFQDPKQFVPRYLRSIYLIKLVMQEKVKIVKQSQPHWH